MSASILKGRIVVGSRVKVTHYRPRVNGPELDAFYGEVVKVRPSGTLLIAREDLSDGAGNPIRLEVQNGTISEAPLPTDDLSADERSSFDWYNNRRVTEHQLMSRKDEGSSFSDGRWETAVITDVDAFLATFEGTEYVIDLDDDRETGDTVRAVALRGRTWTIRIRVRSVYPGLYDNIERLRSFLRTVPLDDDPRELASIVDDALTMILCHDRGERDQLAPAGHCRHGVYVGGCGVDWMCGACEDGSQ